MSDTLDDYNMYHQEPTVYDISIAQGDYVEVPMLLYSGTALIDLTSYTFSASFRRDDVVTEITVTKAPNQTANRGQLSLIIASSVTSLLEGAYSWHIDWIDPLTHRRSLAVGTLRVGIYE
jgi:hypothetical protein